MTDAEPGGERTARRSPQRSPIRGGGATASYSRCRMMLHFDHIRPPTSRPRLCRLTRGARHRFCEDTSSSVGAATRCATTSCQDMHAGKRAN